MAVQMSMLYLWYSVVLCPDENLRCEEIILWGSRKSTFGVAGATHLQDLQNSQVHALKTTLDDPCIADS